MYHPDAMLDSIARLLQEIGEGVTIFYEPRNEGMEWYVGQADSHDQPLPLHEHFSDPIEGLIWLGKHKPKGTP